MSGLEGGPEQRGRRSQTRIRFSASDAETYDLAARPQADLPTDWRTRDNRTISRRSDRLFSRSRVRNGERRRKVRAHVLVGALAVSRLSDT